MSDEIDVGDLCFPVPGPPAPCTVAEARAVLESKSALIAAAKRITMFAGQLGTCTSEYFQGDEIDSPFDQMLAGFFRDRLAEAEAELMEAVLNLPRLAEARDPSLEGKGEEQEGSGTVDTPGR